MLSAQVPEEECPFCLISQTYPPASPTSTPPPSFSPDAISPSTFLVLSTPLCLAFLDILPLSPGHLLLTTRQHRSKLSNITTAESQELGYWLPILSKVLAQVTGVWDWNIVQNNGAAAAQVVGHVHFHIIPRPGLMGGERNKSFTMFGRGQREELDEEEAVGLVGRLRGELGVVVRREKGGRL